MRNCSYFDEFLILFLYKILNKAQFCIVHRKCIFIYFTLSVDHSWGKRSGCIYPFTTTDPAWFCFKLEWLFPSRVHCLLINVALFCIHQIHLFLPPETNR